MIAFDITLERGINQRITHTEFNIPGQVVAWFGAMQAQDYTSAKWAVGLRCSDATEDSVEDAIINGEIVRTWLNRGTKHFAAKQDVIWMLLLLSPVVIAKSGKRYRQLELDDETFTRSFKTLSKALQKEKQLTRADLLLTLEKAGITTEGQRGYHILRRAGLEGLICFGPMTGKQESFVLLDDWVYDQINMSRDEALAGLAKRYFDSHGPATLNDYMWWSGLPVSDARTGLEMVESRLRHEIVNGQIYWMPPKPHTLRNFTPTACLLPAYDEYLLGYKERSAVLDPRYDKKAVSGNGVFRAVILLDGQVVGVWKKEPRKDSIKISSSPFKVMTKTEIQVLISAVKSYSKYCEMPAELD